eukprot:3018876-Amphidinium_carterae.1
MFRGGSALCCPVEEVSGIDGESSEYDFKHIASVGSTEFRPYAMNDVVEGLNGEFYVSEWLRYGDSVPCPTPSLPKDSSNYVKKGSRKNRFPRP